MKKYTALFLLAILMSCGETNNNPTMEKESKTTTYYLIRHAEKDRSGKSNSNPDLNSEGSKRTKKWAEVLKDIKLDAVYSTDYNRTRQTATPTAKQHGLEIKTYDGNKLFSEELKKNTQGKTVLIVGHSNTTPQFANMILGNEKYEDIDDAENGALFIVQVLPDGSKTSQVLYIN